MRLNLLVFFLYEARHISLANMFGLHPTTKKFGIFVLLMRTSKYQNRKSVTSMLILYDKEGK